MATAHTLTFAPKPATGNGDLDGHSVRCSCGFHATTSLSEREARRLGFEHTAWAERSGR